MLDYMAERDTSVGRKFSELKLAQGQKSEPSRAEPSGRSARAEPSRAAIFRSADNSSRNTT